MPVIVMLVLGAVEATSMIFLKQSLQTAAYEATRQAILASSTDAEVLGRANNILNARQVNGFQVNFPLGSPEARNRGQLVSVQVTAPSAANSPLAGRFVRSRNIVVNTVMMKE